MTDTSSTPWHHLSAEDCLARSQSQRAGLDSTTAAGRLQQYGPNRLPQARPRSAWQRLLAQFNNLLIFVLLGSAVLVAVNGDWLDAVVILGVVLINGVIGFAQEGKAEQAMQSIRALLGNECRVLRDGQLQVLDAALLVPGDIVQLEAGDRVPADLRLLACRDLRIDEAMLTGESVPAGKQTGTLALDAALGDRSCMAWSGTLVTGGSGSGLVVATGSGTELGHISHLLHNVVSLQTPLLADMEKFARQLTLIIVLLSALAFVVGVLLRDYPPSEMLLAAVGIAVAAIPEGLPAVLTIVLALGVQRMARQRAIVRRLPAVESLGAVSVICSDKTGTLTRNEMTVQHVYTAAHDYRIEGVGYAPQGTLHCTDSGSGDEARQADADLLLLARTGLLAGNATLQPGEQGWQITGDPTEAALLTLAGKLGLVEAAEQAALPRTDHIPFDADLRLTASLHRTAQGGEICVFGAPEQILQRCSSQWHAGSEQALEPAHWQQRLQDGAAQGLRMLGVARRLRPDASALALEDLDGGFTFLGLVALLDPPRSEVIDAIAECRRAGIVVKMITGDHAATAAAIAGKLGLDGSRALTGQQIDALDDAALDRQLPHTSVFARTTPAHKLRLVERLQALGERVAMTGDGVNDAPALKRADIGIAMGIKGTEAAREAAQMVLADDNFATLGHAVATGRTIYDNLRKSILFILPVSCGQALVLLAAVALGIALPITPLQILWVNMITAVTLSLALAFEPAEPGLMSRPPRDPRLPLLSGYLLWRTLFVALLLTLVSLGLFLYGQQQGLALETCRTLAVNALVAGEIGYLFCVRRLHGRASFGVRDNPWAWGTVAILLPLQLLFSEWGPLQRLFACTDLSLLQWSWVVAAGVLTLLLIELEKRLLGARAG